MYIWVQNPSEKEENSVKRNENAVSAPRKTMELIKIGETPCKPLRKARFGARGKDASGGVMEWRKTLET